MSVGQLGIGLAGVDRGSRADRAVERGNEECDQAEEAHAYAEVFRLARVLRSRRLQPEGRMYERHMTAEDHQQHRQ